MARGISRASVDLHEGASSVPSESASAEFSPCTPSAPPLTYTFKLIELVTGSGLISGVKTIAKSVC
jgi:hypothetical protein